MYGLEGFKAGGLKEVHFAELIPGIENGLHDEFDSDDRVGGLLDHLLQDVRTLDG